MSITQRELWIHNDSLPETTPTAANDEIFSSGTIPSKQKTPDEIRDELSEQLWQIWTHWNSIQEWKKYYLNLGTYDELMMRFSNQSQRIIDEIDKLAITKPKNSRVSITQR